LIHAIVGQRLQMPAQPLVLEVLCLNPRAPPPVQRLALEAMRGQLQRPIRKTQSLQEHRLDACAHRHRPLITILDLFLNKLST
jgi:hypothetical protein